VFDVVPNNRTTLVLRPARDIEATVSIDVAYPAWPSFRLTKEQASGIREQIEDGMRKLPEILDRFEVSSRDRQTLAPLLPTGTALAPPW